MKYIHIFIGMTLFNILGCQHKKHDVHEEATYNVTSPIRQDTIIYKEYVSQIHSIQHIELRALEKGYLQKIYVDEGQFVKKGQLLFQIMPTLYQAEVQKANAEVNFAEIEFLNTKSLADNQIVSPNELALAKAKLQKANAELELAKIHLGFTEIRAPFDGMVGRFSDVRLGSLLDEGELLTTLSDNSKMWVYFNVPEAEYLNYATSSTSNEYKKVKLKLANDQLYSAEGIIETIVADFNNENGNIAFRATFDNPKSLLRNGETGNILKPIFLKEAILIPQKATFEVLDKKYVYVLGDNDELEAVEIKIGVELNHLFEVISGVTDQQKILVDGIRKVKNGQRIKYKVLDQKELWKELLQLHAE